MTFRSFPAIDQGRQEERVPETFQGKSIDSRQEYWIIKSLFKLGYNFIYQYQLFGGYVRGGFIVDFYVEKAPRPVFIEYYGDYWHEGDKASDDALRERIIEHRTGIEVFGVYQKDAATEDDVFSAVRDILR